MTIWFSANNTSSKTKKKTSITIFHYCIIPEIHKMLSFRVYLDEIAPPPP
jgi:hypothetical protein